MNEDKKIFASNLKYLRNESNMSQSQVADILGVSQAAVSEWENGNKMPDNIGQVKIIADLFSVTLDDLLKQNLKHSKSRETIGSIKIPVLGKIPAGIPFEAIEEILDWEEIPNDWLKGNKEYFALKITGNSMEPKYLDGDIIIVLKTSSVENGSDCVVMVNGDDAVFKKVLFSKDSMILQPLNSNYEPIIYTEDQIIGLPVKIIGVAKQIRRTI